MVSTTITPVTDKPYVYKLSYENGIVFYIGKGINERINEHEKEATLKNDKKYNTHKSRVIRKIWKNSGVIVKEIISYFNTDREALDYEIALIFFMKPYGNLANLTDGGEGTRGFQSPMKGKTITEETRRKMSESAKRKHKMMSEDTRLKLNESLKKSASSMSDEKRRKIHESRKTVKGLTPFKGKTHTDETKLKISESVKLSIDDNRRTQMREVANNRSEETRRKMSEGVKRAYNRKKSVE